MKRVILFSLLLASVILSAYAASKQCEWVNATGGRCQNTAFGSSNYCSLHLRP